MKKAVAVGIAAVALIAAALLLRKPPREIPQSEVQPRPSEEGSSEVRKIREGPVDWVWKAPAPAEAPPETRRLLADLAKALRNGDEQAARTLVQRLHDQLYPPLPDDRNGALIYQKAFDVAREKMGGLSMKGLDNAVYSAVLTSKEITPEQSAALRGWFDRNGTAAAEVLALLRDAGQLPECRFSEPNPRTATAMSYACNLLRVAAVVQLQDGQAGAAADQALAGLGMARAIRSSPNLVSQMLGCVFDSQTLEGLQGPLSPATPRIAEWIDAADPASVRDSYLRALLGDVDSTVSGILEAPKDAGSPLVLQDLAAYVEGISDFTKHAGRSYYEVREEIDALARQHGELAPWYASLSHSIAPAMPGLSRAIARSEAQTSMAKLGLALERYREKNGSYPATLDALGGPPPRDPFSGQPFTYRREGGGFVIESAGDGKRPLNWTRR